MRTYRLLKTDFMCEPFICLIKKQKYVFALARFRAGSHSLEIERGRYTNPKTPAYLRLCSECHEVEDEIHFLITCKRYENERRHLFDSIIRIQADFEALDDQEKFVYLMRLENEQILTWIAKFIHDSMNKREIYYET